MENAEIKLIDSSKSANRVLSLGDRFIHLFGSPALFYLAVTIPSGLLLIFFDKYPSWPDSADHWNRVLQIGQGHLLAQANPDGSGSYGGFGTDGVFHVFNNTAINSPIAYFPGILGFGHKKLAAVFTLLICAFIIAIAIRLARIYELAFLGIGLLPIVFTSICWPTADAFTNAFSLLFVAYVVHLLQMEKQISRQSMFLLCFMSLILGFIKITCAILFLLVWILPISRRSTNQSKSLWLTSTCASLCTAFSFLLWSLLTVQVPPSAVVNLEDFSAAKHRILEHPLLMIRSLLISFIQPISTTGDAADIERNVQLFTGIGPDALMPAGIMVPVLIACCLLIIQGCKGIRQYGFGAIVISALVVLLFFALTGAGLESSWGAPSLGSYIGGLQSRYYIPIYAVLILLMPNLRLSFGNKKCASLVIRSFIICSYLGILLSHCLPFPGATGI